MYSILFVCLGNICRSPAAEGTLLHLHKQEGGKPSITVESCGLGDWHEGKLPDERMRRAALERGVVLSSRAQEFRPEFFDRFDYIFVADRAVMGEIYQRANNPKDKNKVYLITAFSSTFPNHEIPDPFYGEDADFELVMDMVTDACAGLLKHLNSSLR